MLPWPMWPRITLASGKLTMSSSMLHEKLDQRVNQRVVGVVPVQQRVHLDPEEFRMIEEGGSLLDEARLLGVRPVEAVGRLDPLDDLPDHGVVGMEDHAGVDLMLAEDSGQSLGIEAHIEQRELADMHVRINSHRFTPG